MDLNSGLSLPGPSADCAEPAFVYPRFFSNIPFTANYVAHALFSSNIDRQLDMGKESKVYVLGADDDFVAWGDYPSCETANQGACYCEHTDRLTGLTYRGLNTQTGVTLENKSSSACRLIDRAIDAKTNYESAVADDKSYYFEQWRFWIERLEFARDLYRIYNDR